MAVSQQGRPNDWRLVKEDAVGIRYPPLATRDHRRNGTRERLLEVQKNYPLHIALDALASQCVDRSGDRG